MRKQHFRLRALFIVLTFLATLGAATIAKASPAQNERLVVGQIKRLYEIQVYYLQLFGQGNFASLNTLAAAGLIDGVLAEGVKYGYVFSISQTEATTTLPSRFVVMARPPVYRKTGIRSFYMNNTCLVTGADRQGGDAGPTDPLVDECTPTWAYAHERNAIRGERSVAAAEFTYFTTLGNNELYATHNQLLFANLLEPFTGPMNSTAFGCQWTITPRAATMTEGPTFVSLATPRFYRETGIRSLYIDQTGVLRGADHMGQPATENDPVIEE